MKAAIETKGATNVLRLFVTGDNHIGLKYNSHPARETLVACRTEAFRGMVAKANDEDCQLFVITGDLFDNVSGMTDKQIKAVLDILSEFHGTVALLPGNHDYCGPEAKLTRQLTEAISRYHNVLLMTEERPYPLEDGVTLYPAACHSKHSETNALGWIKQTVIPQDGGYHIGVAHGAVEGETIDNEGKYFFMKRDELNAIPMDVWLLGHTHVPFPGTLTADYAPTTERIFNPGTHVQTDVNCRTPGLCFLLELSEDKTVRAKQFVSGGVRFYREEIHLHAGSMTQELAQAVAGYGPQSVLEFKLTGAVTQEELDNLIPLEKQLESRFLECTWHDEQLGLLISQEQVAREFPETSFSARFLNALLDEPKEAQLAYDLLKSLKGGRKA